MRRGSTWPPVRGKAALLAGLATERDGALLAADRAPHRARLVARTLEGAPGHHLPSSRPTGRSARGDQGRSTGCCSTRRARFGVLRRRPEVRWRREPDDVAALASLQRDLLAAAVDAVRVGEVGYATCSPHLAETVVVVDDAVRGGLVERVDVPTLLPEVDHLGPGRTLRLWPHVHGTDGMYPRDPAPRARQRPCGVSVPAAVRRGAPRPRGCGLSPWPGGGAARRRRRRGPRPPLLTGSLRRTAHRHVQAVGDVAPVVVLHLLADPLAEHQRRSIVVCGMRIRNSSPP